MKHSSKKWKRMNEIYRANIEKIEKKQKKLKSLDKIVSFLRDLFSSKRNKFCSSTIRKNLESKTSTLKMYP